MKQAQAPELARQVAAALRSDAPETMAADVAQWRSQFDKLHFVHEAENVSS